MLVQSPSTSPGRPRGAASVRRKVSVWGAVLIILLLSPATLSLLFSGILDVVAIEWLAFVWGFVAVGYFLGVWLCTEAARKGLNGLAWGLFFAGPWWPFALVAYSFASYQRPFVQPPA